MSIIIAGNSGGALPLLTNPATAADILYGKQAINGSGILLTGTIPSKASSILQITKEGGQIAAGQYLAGTQTIPAEANLTAANIRQGISIFGVNGTFSGNVAEGSFYVSSGGSSSWTIEWEGNFIPNYYAITLYSMESAAAVFPVMLYLFSNRRLGSMDESWEFSSQTPGRVDVTETAGSLTIDLSRVGVYFAPGTYDYLLAE